MPGFLGHFTEHDSLAPHRVAAASDPIVCRQAIAALLDHYRQTALTIAPPESVAVLTVDDTLYHVVLRRDQPAGEWYPTAWFGHDWHFIAGLLL